MAKGNASCRNSRCCSMKGKRGKREAMARARGNRPEHLWCSQGSEKKGCHRGSNAIGDWGVGVKGRGGTNKAGSEMLQALLCWGQIYEQRLNLRRS